MGELGGSSGRSAHPSFTNEEVAFSSVPLPPSPSAPDGEPSTHCLTLIGGSASSAAARQFVRSVLGTIVWPGDVEAAVLLASELVSNAAQHAGGATELTVLIDGAMLRVEAADRSSRKPRLQHPDPLDDAGRGLLLVDVLSSDWGVRDRVDGGKTVWFELHG